MNVRVIAATDANLEQACAQGTFRAPLFHRLAAHTVHIPPLRARPVDIPVQAVAFMRDAIAATRQRWPTREDGAPWLGRPVIEALLDASWPGNTRELRAAVERLVLRDLHAPACGLPDREGVAMSPQDPGPSAVEVSAARAVDSDARAALEATNYRLGAAAARLGISRNALKRRMEGENIRRPVDLGASEIAEALARGGTLAEGARLLAVSEHGLKLRAGELGIAWTA